MNKVRNYICHVLDFLDVRGFKFIYKPSWKRRAINEYFGDKGKDG